MSSELNWEKDIHTALFVVDYVSGFINYGTI